MTLVPSWTACHILRHRVIYEMTRHLTLRAFHDRAADARVVYDQASKALTAYLEGAKLPPRGSPDYNVQP
jgi:hypothetical protein